MEILQTIWTNLTTENPTMITIISIPFTFIEVYILMLLSTTLLNIKTSSKQELLYILITGSIGILSDFLIYAPLDSFINIIVVLLSIIFIFKTNIFKSLLAFIVPFIITIILESMLLNFYNTIFNTDNSTILNIPINRLSFSLLIYFLEYISCIIIKKFKISFSKLEIQNKKVKILLILTNVLAIALIFSQLHILTFYSKNMPLFITLLNLIGLITYASINIYAMITVTKLETTSTNLEEAQLYNKTLEILQDNTRAFRHDFANILQGMVGYMDNNDMEGLKKYYSQLVDDIHTSNNLTTLSPKVVNNPAIYNVLASKYHKADSLGIKINLEAFLDMNDLHMKIYEFTRVLGILMDNAIEASSECENKIINVTFRKDSKRNMQLLIIENTYKDKDVDTDKIFEKGYSTKQGNTGLGLWEIRQILKKNNNLNLFTTKNETFFTQQFEIFY